MSTTYRLTGQGTRWSIKRWRQLAKDNGFRVLAHPQDGHWMLDTPGGVVHLSGGKRSLNYFDRYGGNDPQPLLDALDIINQGWLSEHDEGYFA